GNWSFGDYFKKEAIAWSWELLTDVYKMDKGRLYVTVFEGDAKEKLAFDQESYDCWKALIAEDRILRGNKKDNFWEMGDSGPCGPCTEIHVDLRSDAERAKVDGKALVNASHPQVIEIWNNVFMEFNRKADGSLEPLPARHVDTGMGFERLCMAMQGKTSNYDTDVFQPMIQFIAARCGVKYGAAEKTDIAMRVMSDHIRAIAFAIADGQLPSNNKAGYVIRRILRRAVRYGFTFLDFKEPFLNKLVPILAEQLKDVFPELKAQQDFVMRVIHEEEAAFLRTLETGIRKFEEHGNKKVEGTFAFELYDTYGFPIDLTQLMAREKGLDVDMDEFSRCLNAQKERSRSAAVVDTDDWVVLRSGEDAVEFVGYDELSCEAELIKYRKVTSKGKASYQLVLNRTPFYAESGGQVGDTGQLVAGSQRLRITDTRKENNLIVHLCDRLPEDPMVTFHAEVDGSRRAAISNNHSATHLMHSALKQVLGTHVNQKGSLVNDAVTRFDFSHFAKVTDEELAAIERMVNSKIRENIALDEQRNVPVGQAMEMGATALFGEKYGEFVRVITFDPSYSRELCGGTHVSRTGEIGLFKIVSEGAVAAGVRRVEAITASAAEAYYQAAMAKLESLQELLKHKDVVEKVNSLLEENATLRATVDGLVAQKARALKGELIAGAEIHNSIRLIARTVDLPSADAIKDLSFELRNQFNDLVFLAAAVIDGKPFLSLIISDDLVTSRGLNATTMIRELAKEVQGGGGGQPFYATAGGKKPEGLQAAVDKVRSLLG
ncbi:MAG: hypothetical protein RL021_162, partial [Bacteroidota bacterium]